MWHYFVIDTDRYAGGFERELCAYITGIIGECGVGQVIADYANKSAGVKTISNFIGQEADEHGCDRPVKIYPTPGVYNNGMGFHYKKGEEDKAIEAWKKSCQKEAEYIECAYVDKGYGKTQAKRLIDMMNEPLKEYPAYQSIAIKLDETPPEDILQKMCERAKEFSDMCNSGTASKTIGCSEFNISKFNITGFRLVTEEIVSKEKVLSHGGIND